MPRTKWTIKLCLLILAREEQDQRIRCVYSVALFNYSHIYPWYLQITIFILMRANLLGAFCEFSIRDIFFFAFATTSAISCFNSPCYDELRPHLDCAISQANDSNRRLVIELKFETRIGFLMMISYVFNSSVVLGVTIYCVKRRIKGLYNYMRICETSWGFRWVFWPKVVTTCEHSPEACVTSSMLRLPAWSLGPLNYIRVCGNWFRTGFQDGSAWHILYGWLVILWCLRLCVLLLSVCYR